MTECTVTVIPTVIPSLRYSQRAHRMGDRPLLGRLFGFRALRLLVLRSHALERLGGVFRPPRNAASKRAFASFFE
jgi:hypothetical protein